MSSHIHSSIAMRFMHDLPREICRILIVDENFIVKWSRESLVRQSYQIAFRAWKSHTLVELICRYHVSAQIIHGRTLDASQKLVECLGEIQICRHDDVDIGEECVESLAILTRHIAKKVLRIGKLQQEKRATTCKFSDSTVKSHTLTLIRHFFVSGVRRFSSSFNVCSGLAQLNIDKSLR